MTEQKSQRIVYVNGQFLAEEEAKISVFDRGFLFADGVYEVTSVIDGKLVDNRAHMARLKRSMDELQMAAPMPLDDIPPLQRELVEKNALVEGALYLQVTRGAADRDFAFPQEAQPSLVMFTQEKNLSNPGTAETGIRVITLEDIRWARRDIKTVQLLAPSLAKQAALDAGADDAWLTTDGMVNEGSSNNTFIIDQDGNIITRNLGSEILHGITRRAVLALARQEGIEVIERPFSIEEAKQAREAFITSATMFVTGVTAIDDTPIGNAGVGMVTSKLRALYLEMARKEAE